MSKGSRINSTLAPERYSAIELLVRFSSTPKLCSLHFAVEWAKDKTSGRITKWGILSLAGIVTSAALGIAAQLQESSLQQKAQEAAMKQTLQLVSETHQSVIDIRRSLAQLDDPVVDAVFDSPCIGEFADFCSAAKESYRRNPFSALLEVIWQKWPGGPTQPLLLGLFFFSNAERATDFIKDFRVKPDWLLVFRGAHSKNQALASQGALEASGSASEVRIALPMPSSPFFNENNGKIQSVLDLSGVTLVVVAIKGYEIFTFPESIRMRPMGITLRFRNGRTISLDASRFKDVSSNNGAMYQTKLTSESCGFTC
jgi:hypothetical protein